MNLSKSLILLIVFLTSFGCNENPTIQPSKERLQDINEIVKAIIIQDSIFDNPYLDKITWFCIDLQKVNLFPKPKYAEGELNPPPPPPDMFYESLLQLIGMNRDSFFLSEDTIEFKLQNKYPNFIRIDPNIIKVSHPIIYDSTFSIYKKEYYSLFKMNIPIFSKNGQRACVYLGYHCGGTCGGGNAYYLRKEKSGWKIVYSHPTWIS